MSQLTQPRALAPLPEKPASTGANPLPVAASRGGPPRAATIDRSAPREDNPRRYDLHRREWWFVAGVGVWLLTLELTTLAGVIWAWGVIDRLGEEVSLIHWIGPDFTATAATGGLVLAAAGGVAGSVVHATSLFSERVGRRTFEVSYVWWYLLRPVQAALLAIVLVVAIRAGLITLVAGGNDTAANVLTFLAGALAGLFTDRVMQRLRGLLGATRIDERASEQRPSETVSTPRNGSVGTADLRPTSV